jgi:hypothetical protein
LASSYITYKIFHRLRIEINTKKLTIKQTQTNYTGCTPEEKLCAPRQKQKFFGAQIGSWTTNPLKKYVYVLPILRIDGATTPHVPYACMECKGI